MTTAHRLVDDYVARVSDLEAAFHDAWWSSQTEANEATERRRAELELELRTVKGDPETLAQVNEVLEHDLQDPILGRQLLLMRLSLLENQMTEEQREVLVDLSSSIENDFSAYRPEVDGESLSENEIEEILKTSDDSDLRRRAWEGSKEVGTVVADRVRETVRLSNEVARSLGYADHYRFALDLQEIPESWMFDVLDELARLTEAPFARWKAELDARLSFRFGTDELWPWHYADPFFQSLPPDGRITLDEMFGETSAAELAQRTFSGWGIDVSSVLTKSDLYPRENKSQHAFCIDMDRSGEDVRILANVVPGERWIEVMLHESGHAAYDISIDPKLPWLLHGPSHILTTEAIALLSGRIVRDPTWLRGIAQIADEEVSSIGMQLRSATNAQALIFARWCLVMIHFERDLYSDPEGDLNARWWELVERFQMITPPRDRDRPDWASKIHLAISPVYYQNYLLGELFAAQLRATCDKECGGLVGSPDAGRLLIDRVFHPGALMSWDSLVEQATGRPLSADDFAAELSA